MWVPTLHTHYSFHRSIAKPKALAKKCAEREFPAAILCDYGNVGAAVDFVTALKEPGVKPILGCQFNLCKGDPTDKTVGNGKPYDTVKVIAKNMEGWRGLLRAVSYAGSQEVAHLGPRISVEALGEYTQGGNLLAISGGIGSDIANAVFTNPKKAYMEVNEGGCLSLVNQEDKLTGLVEKYLSVFGKGNFFLEVQNPNPESLPAMQIVADAIRRVGKSLKVPLIASWATHYINKKDATDQRVLVCAGLHTTLSGRSKRLTNEPDPVVGAFFQRDYFHFPTLEEIQVNHTEGEIKNSLELANLCEQYDITSQPKLPKFPCPDGLDPDTYLKRLCWKGWNQKIAHIISPDKEEEYLNRLKMEYEVIKGAGLSSYFLIVQDFMNYGRSRGWMLGKGRGSSGGCIISYLTGITEIDPIPYGLIFERFYNAGRNTPGRTSLPDIDVDVPKNRREEIYKYLQNKYGYNMVAKIAVFATMQGRSALTEVMRVHEVNFDTIKRITKVIPDKARISEELQEMKERGEEPSIISYCLDTFSTELAEWVQEQEDGTLTGEYGAYFSQARRLEGTKTHIGTHAAGVVIGTEPLANLCPLKWDDGVKANIAAMEYPALESLGLCKIDILAVAFLDKMEGVRSLLRTGRVNDAR